MFQRLVEYHRLLAVVEPALQAQVPVETVYKARRLPHGPVARQQGYGLQGRGALETLGSAPQDLAPPHGAVESEPGPVHGDAGQGVGQGVFQALGGRRTDLRVRVRYPGGLALSTAACTASWTAMTSCPSTTTPGIP